MIRTYRFRVYPTNIQVHALERSLNICRELYNSMLEQRIYAHGSSRKVNYNSQQDELPGIKVELPEFRDVHSLVLQDVARRLDRAFDNFFRRVGEIRSGKHITAGFPRFKSKDRYNSITYTQSGFRITDNGHVWLSKIGELRMFMHRPIVGEIKTLSIKRDRVGDWFVTVAAQDDTTAPETEAPTSVHNSQSEQMKPIGVDMGLRSIITTSEGLRIEPPKYLRKMERKLKKAQKQLSRKKKGSGKRTKARKKVAVVHRKIERQRDDFTHKVSRSLVENHDLIVFEDLNITGMVKNHHLAKSITDAGWNKIIQYTTYKAESAGATVLLVDPQHTSQKCSECGNRKDDLMLSDQIYHCDVCGLTTDRDVNAAINIRNIGLMKVGRGTPEYTPVEIGALPVMATRVVETGSLRL